MVRTGEKVENVSRDGAVFRLQTPVARVSRAPGRAGDGTSRLAAAAGRFRRGAGQGLLRHRRDGGLLRHAGWLVIGGGDSAIESALGLANQDGTEVALVYRGEAFSRVKDRNRAKIDAAIASGRVRPFFRSQVREIRPDVIVLDVDGETSILPNDDTVVRIGGDAPYAFLERLGVRIVQKEIALTTESETETARAG